MIPAPSVDVASPGSAPHARLTIWSCTYRSVVWTVWTVPTICRLAFTVTKLLPTVITSGVPNEPITTFDVSDAM